jgi:hypothetical protein
MTEAYNTLDEHQPPTVDFPPPAVYPVTQLLYPAFFRCASGLSIVNAIRWFRGNESMRKVFLRHRTTPSNDGNARVIIHKDR